MQMWVLMTDQCWILCLQASGLGRRFCLALRTFHFPHLFPPFPLADVPQHVLARAVFASGLVVREGAVLTWKEWLKNGGLEMRVVLMV